MYVATASSALWGYVSSKFVPLIGEVCKFRTAANGNGRAGKVDVYLRLFLYLMPELSVALISHLTAAK